MRPEPNLAASGEADGMLVDRTFPSDFRWVRRIIHETQDALKAGGCTADDIGSVEIVLAEAMNNVVEHAYSEQQGIGDITLQIRRRGKFLMIEVRDKGKPMPNGRAPLGNHPMVEFHAKDAMPEGGYGWFLIRELVLDLIYDRRDGENVLFMTYRMGQR